MDALTIVMTIVAGGMFGVILNKFLDTTPDWVFWGILAIFFILTGFLLVNSRSL